MKLSKQQKKIGVFILVIVIGIIIYKVWKIKQTTAASDPNRRVISMGAANKKTFSFSNTASK